MFNYELENGEYENLEECVKDVYKLASKAAIQGIMMDRGGPFGAGIIYKKDNGRYIILSIESNEVLSTNDPTAHAEINAIRKACKMLNTRTLENCILVTTARSCPMCLAASCWANIKTIYYSEDYRQAIMSGFKDNKISEYLKGNESELIEEKRLIDLSCKEPFELWNSKTDKILY